MTIYGWDASHYDWDRGPMDLVAARKAGISFFTHKSSEGTGYRDPKFKAAMSRGRDAGIPLLGAYHVVRSPRNAEQEVNFFLDVITDAIPWWRDFDGFFIQVDLEKWPYDSVPAAEGEDFADIVEKKSGRVAVIYASRGQYGDSLRGTSHSLWNADYGTNVAGDFKQVYAARGGDKGRGWTAYSGRTPILWQYGSKTRIASQPTCDANAFRGTLAQLTALVTEDDMLTDKEHNMLTEIYNATRYIDGRVEAITGGREQVYDNPAYLGVGKSVWPVQAIKAILAAVAGQDADIILAEIRAQGEQTRAALAGAQSAILAALPEGDGPVSRADLVAALTSVLGALDGATPAQQG